MTGPRESKFDNQEYREMQRALEDSPPVITWVLRGGVLVAVEVDEGHKDRPNQRGKK